MKLLFSRNILIALFLFIFLNSINANHIVGGQIEYKWISGNNYQLTLDFYRDYSSGTGFLSTSKLCFFDKVNGTPGPSFVLPLVSTFTLTLGDACYRPSIQIEQGIYTATITIPDNPNGYYITNSIRARNITTLNIITGLNVGITFYAEMPDPAIHNSSPVFINYPKGFMCATYPNVENLSATDADGDSLAYFLETPLDTSECHPKPFPLIQWNTASGYSFANMLGAGSTLTLDPVTGILNSTPQTTGLFALAFRAEEWRAGVKIGEVWRDIQYTVLNCTPNLPPGFVTQPSYTSNNIVAGDSLCFDISVEDLNTGDGVYIREDSPEMSGVITTAAPALIITPNPADSATAPIIANVKVCIVTQCENIRPAPYHLTIYGKDASCYPENTINYDLDIYVIPPGIVDLYPNVFTPNGDNINDNFQTNTNPNACFDEFNIKIYDRWGSLVFQSSDFMFRWNGKINGDGNRMDDGVYYYILTSGFRDIHNEKQGFVHLFGNK